jgi:type IX secretion system PorP/SprF family membrane protein
MKRTLYILSFLLIGTTSIAQQSPLSENYFLDKYSFAPSYAGGASSKFIYLGYRSDWTGITGGPKTFRLSYNDVLPYMKGAGYGAKMIYDKAGIFNQLFIEGSYSYNLQVSGDHHLLFGLSMGFYHNAINLLEYYNDPAYNLDPALIQEDVKSKLKFMSDFSMIYEYKGLEAGLLFSNISFGNASYKNMNLVYNPVTNWQFHASYLYTINDDWQVDPLLLIRGGKYEKAQLEFAGQAIWKKQFMGNIMFRSPGVLGFGAGAEVMKGLKIYYNFNIATNVAAGLFNNHEISLGFNIFDYIGTKDHPMVN